MCELLTLNSCLMFFAVIMTPSYLFTLSYCTDKTVSRFQRKVTYGVAFYRLQLKVALHFVEVETGNYFLCGSGKLIVGRENW